MLLTISTQGILISLAIFFIAATMFVCERLKPAGTTKSYLLYKRGSNAQLSEKQGKDEEDQVTSAPQSSTPSSEKTAVGSEKLKTSNTTLSWRRLNYHVKGLHLLKDVEGFVRPGELCALSE